MKTWVIVVNKRNCVLLHYVEKKFEQYHNLIRVPDWIVKRIKQQKTQIAIK